MKHHQFDEKGLWVHRLDRSALKSKAKNRWQFRQNRQLVGGWTNPFEKYSSKWESSPNRGENKTYLKPPPRQNMTRIESTWIWINECEWTCHGVNFWQIQGMCQLRLRDEHWIINIVFSVLSCPVRTSCMEIAVFRKDSCRVTVVLQQQAPPMP